MVLNRRKFLGAASFGALIAARPSLAGSVMLAAPANTTTAPSQRSVLNIGFASGAGNEYRFIDHFRNAEQFGPVSGWNTGPTWMQSIGANGFPVISIKATDNKPFGAGLRIPASFNYGEVGSGQYYVLRWSGNGEVMLALNAGSWTYQAGKSRNATPVSSNRWRTTSGAAGTYIVLSYSGPAQLFPVYVFATDPGNTGAYLQNLQFYRLDDEADLLAGKIFRTAYKQTIVDLCPSAIRFMDWVGGNDSKLTRFESRTLPGYAAWTGSSNWVASPPYGETTGTNQYALAAARGTPAAPLQGEIVSCRIGSGMQRGGAKTVSAVSNGNPGRVTAVGHGFVTGDVIIHQFASGVMPRLNLFPCKITVIDANNYTIGVDTTSFGMFSGSGTANQFITLDVGGRGAYPVTFPSPGSAASTWGNGYIAAGDYKTFIFDKTVALRTDGAGNYVYGVWMFNDSGANNGHAGGVPLEICTALVNEVNAMRPAHPIHMWMNIPHLGLCSMDPDFSIRSSWGIQAVNAVLNGANGFSGLNASSQLFVEFSNETWNTGGGNSVSQTFYLAYRGFQRWPASGTADYASMASLRSVVNAEDIKRSPYNDPRLRFVLSGQGTLGVSGLNAARIDGNKFYLGDPLNMWGPSVAPMVHHDYFAFAGYFAPDPSFDAANLNSLASTWVANIGNAAAQEAACKDYVNGIVNPAVGGNETVDRYLLTLLPAYAAKMRTYGKYAIMYEGGWDHGITPVTSMWHVTPSIPFASGVIDGVTNTIKGVATDYAAALAPGHFVVGYGIPPMTRIVSVSGTTVTLSNTTTISLRVAQFIAFTPQQMFLLAVKRSQSWAGALLAYFNGFGASSGMPADYVASDLRWGHSSPTAYGFANTEWGDLDLLWQQQGGRNRALS